jgi:phosphatidylcholine synthase
MSEGTEHAAKPEAPTAAQQLRAYSVHVYTASGIAFAFGAAMEICSAIPDPRHVFLLLLCAVLVDATDGTLARRWHVKRWAATIDGRTIDDIVDYLTYTFLPLLLMWRMGWVAEPAGFWIIPALIASLFGFSNRGAKDETSGFFLGFPSYWNVVAFYGGLWRVPGGPWINAALLIALAVLTVLPVRFLYPNLTPRPWRTPILLGAFVWMLTLAAILWDYPNAPLWLILLSLLYPVFYTAVSIGTDARWRRDELKHP